MESLQYEAAIDIYQQIIEKEAQPEAITNLAIAYKKLNDYKQAIPWFEKAIQLEDVKPEIFYYYGQSLQYTGACDLAKSYFEQYLRLRPYDLRREVLMDPCKEHDRLVNLGASSDYEVVLLPINGPLDDLGPAFYQNGLVFGAIKEESTKRKSAFFDLYFAAQTAEDIFSFEAPSQFSSELNSKLNEAIVTFNSKETAVYITRNRQEPLDPRRNPVVRLEILSAQKQEDGIWSDLQPLPFNDISYSVAHPCLSSEGERLFFSSDRPGGFGGKDIYLSFWDGGQWGNPINLGPGINTEGDELFPFYHESGQLYFASDGHIGLGGQDIYVVNDLGNGQWSKVMNVGPPINTNADDFGMIIHSKGAYGFFNSNRDGGAGADDIYGFRKKMPERVQNYQFTIFDGISKAPLEGLSVWLDHTETLLEAAADGTYALAIKEGACFTLSIKAEGYQDKTWEECVRSVADNLSKSIIIGMQAIEKDLVEKEVEELMTFFDIAVLDNLTGLGVQAANVKIKGEGCDFEFEGHTDEKGWLRIAAPSICCSNLTIESENYFLHKSTNAFCDLQPGSVVHIPIQPFVRVSEAAIEPRNMASNPQDTLKIPFKISEGNSTDEKVSYLLNIYYDVGRTSVKKESVPELFRLLALLKDNPALIVEIGSHTDAQGQAQFNQKLSQRRADNIVQWLVGEGISRRKLVARGYGESKPVNDCVDGKECSEKEYQMNRRTEFRVIGRLD